MSAAVHVQHCCDTCATQCLRLLHMTTVFALYCSHQHWHHETVLFLHLANLQHENLSVRLYKDLSMMFEPSVQCCCQDHSMVSNLHVAPGSSILFFHHLASLHLLAPVAELHVQKQSANKISVLSASQGEVPGAAKIAADSSPHWSSSIPYSQHGKQWQDPDPRWQLECQQQQQQQQQQQPYWQWQRPGQLWHC